MIQRINKDTIRAAADQTADQRKTEALRVARDGEPREIMASATTFAKLDKSAMGEVKQAIRDREFPTRRFSIQDLGQAVKEEQKKLRRMDVAQKSSDRAEVEIDDDEYRANDEVVDALAKHDDGIYHRGGSLVRIVTTEDEAAGGVHRSAGSHKIGDMPIANLRERVSRHVVLAYDDSEGERRTMHPRNGWHAASTRGAKGDVARALFYAAIRYEDAGLDLELIDYAPEQGDGRPLHGVLPTLLRWHVLDPPDDFERRRNDRVEERQGNRNPFIDEPGFVGRVWG